MSEKKIKIVSGTLIHNRMFVLPYFLHYLEKVEGIDKRIFLANNCTEECLSLLSKYGQVYEYNEVDSTENRSSGRFHTLVKLRNRLLDIVFKEHKADFLMSVDSDILPQPKIVKNLLEFDKDFISALVYNDLHFGRQDRKHTEHIGNIMSFSGNSKNHFKHIKPIVRNILIPVDMTGAVVLISKQVYSSGVKYVWHRQGEDPGFALECYKKGIQQFCFTQLQEHVMLPNILENLIKEGKVKEIALE